MKDMLGRGETLSVRAALQLITKNISSITPEETVPIADSYGRVLSRDIISPEDLPGFARSTVDGYAVLSADTFGSPAYINVIGEVFMGAPNIKQSPLKLQRGEAAKIPTGGMLPDGADAVLMFEHAQEIDGSIIEAQRQLAPGENVIAKDEDVKKGEHLLGAGSRIRPADAALLAGLGIREVAAHARPRVSIISTGDEIVPYDSPLGPGLIRDTNSFAMAGLIAERGGLAIRRGIIRDEYAALREALLGSLADSDMALISGGSSVGVRDMVSRVIEENGRIIFHGVSMKPGKPFIAGVVRGIPVFGLPGHPVSAIQCFETFVAPAIDIVSGLRKSRRACTLTASLAKSVRSQAGRHDFFRVRLEERDGALYAIPVLGKSGLLSTLLRADGVIEVPPDRLGIEEGEPVEVRLI